MGMRLTLTEESLHQLKQLSEGLPRQGIEFLTDGLLVVPSKSKSLRFFAPGRGLLKQRLRYATQAKVAFDRFLLAYLSRFQPDDLFTTLMKDFHRPAIAPDPNHPAAFPVQRIGE